MRVDERFVQVEVQHLCTCRLKYEQLVHERLYLSRGDPQQSSAQQQQRPQKLADLRRLSKSTSMAKNDAELEEHVKINPSTLRRNQSSENSLPPHMVHHHHFGWVRLMSCVARRLLPECTCIHIYVYDTSLMCSSTRTQTDMCRVSLRAPSLTYLSRVVIVVRHPLSPNEQGTPQNEIPIAHKDSGQSRKKYGDALGYCQYIKTASASMTDRDS